MADNINSLEKKINKIMDNTLEPDMFKNNNII